MVDDDIRTGTAIKGSLDIRDNDFDGMAREDPDGLSPFEWTGGMDDRAFEGYSHFLYWWYIDADVTVSNNTIKNFATIGIGGGGYFRVMIIRGDHVVSGPHHFSGVGIQTAEDGYTRTLFGKAYGEGDKETASTRIRNNTVEVQGDAIGNGVGILTWLGKGVEVRNNSISASLGLEGESPWAGILAYASEDTIISHNKVQGEAIEWAAISIEDDAYGCLVEHNQVSGSGRAAVQVGWPGYENSGNTIRRNNLRGFTPVPTTDMWGATTLGTHIALVWGATQNTINGNLYSPVDPLDAQLSNIYFAGAIPPYGLPGARQNAVRERGCLKIMDYTDPNGPLYDPATYAGENDIQLRQGGKPCDSGASQQSFERQTAEQPGWDRQWSPTWAERWRRPIR